MESPRRLEMRRRRVGSGRWRRFALSLLALVCATFAVPAASSAASPSTITIAAASPAGASNCYPFGRADEWTPFSVFVYKNVPAFALEPGDILAFDTSVQNESNIELDIALARTTVNGGSTNAQPFTQVVSNTQTPANPLGDETIGNYELQFTTQSGFDFPGGGLIIRFSNPSPGFQADTMCTTNLVSGESTDTSGFFVERSFSDPDGVAPWSFTDPSNIGQFRLTLFPSSNSFSIGKLTRNKNKGTAILPVDVSGPGTLSLTGKGVKTQRTMDAVASKTVTAAGRVNLRIKAKGKKRKKLNNTGKVRVKVNVTFAPGGNPAGDPSTVSRRVKLVKSD